MTQSISRLPRLAADQPLVVGMILANEDGRSVIVTYVGTRVATVADAHGAAGYSHDFVRTAWPFLAAPVVEFDDGGMAEERERHP